MAKADVPRPIVPASMEALVDRAGNVPAVSAGNSLFCAGQVGRNPDLSIIHEPERQFEACWANLETVLAERGCSFQDIVEMTTYHVQMSANMKLFVEVKDRIFPRGLCAWTCVGVSELAHAGLLAEVKVVALIPGE